MSVLNAKNREQGPASLLKKLRRDGYVPMALIDHGHKVVLIQAKAREARAAIASAGGVGMLKLQIEGEKGARDVIVKQIDQDTLKHELLTVTLAEVRADDKIKHDLEVVPVGVPTAVAEGAATLTQPTSTVKVRGKIADIPEKLEVDVSGMELAHAVTAAELHLPKDVELISSPDATIFSVQLIRAAHEAVEEVLAEGAATPEAETTEE